MRNKEQLQENNATLAALVETLANNPTATELQRMIETHIENTEDPHGISDHIVEEGTSGIWYYIKRKSGRCELYAHTLLHPTSTTQWGSTYYSEAFTIALPFVVGDRVVNGNAGNLCYVCNMGSGGAYASTDLRLASPTEFAPEAMQNGIPVNLVVYGTWKQ